MPVLAELVDGVIGVDPHRDTLAAAALSSVGGVRAEIAVSADAAGYQAAQLRRCPPGWPALLGNRGRWQLRRGPGRLPARPR
jgi:hypothetical protein